MYMMKRVLVALFGSWNMHLVRRCVLPRYSGLAVGHAQVALKTLWV